MNECWCGNNKLGIYSDDYYICSKCGTLVTRKDITSNITNISDEINDMYGSNYWKSLMLKESKEKDISSLIKAYFGGRVLYWMRYIERYIPMDSTVAEVGCGLGQLSYVMNFMGYNQSVYELSPEICRFLEKKMGLKTICGELGCVDEIYESIIVLDVLEHLTNPKEFLIECSKRLWGRRILCCQTPEFTEEWSYEDMLKKMPSFKNLLVPDQHIYIFSKRAIRKLLTEVGLGYISFEPAAFGEHYDMFFFASSKPIKVVTEDELKNYYTEHPNRLLTNVLMSFFDILNKK